MNIRHDPVDVSRKADEGLIADAKSSLDGEIETLRRLSRTADAMARLITYAAKGLGPEDLETFQLSVRDIQDVFFEQLGLMEEAADTVVDRALDTRKVVRGCGTAEKARRAGRAPALSDRNGDRL